jgi:hypothetical protein
LAGGSGRLGAENGSKRKQIMIRVLRDIVLVAFAVAVASCNPAPVRNEPGSSSPERSSSSSPSVAKKTFDLGDAETSLKLEAKVGAASTGPAVKVDEMLDFRKKLMMTTVAVTPPAPKEFWVTFILQSSSAFKEAPVVVRGKVFRDNSEAGAFATVLGADATTKPFKQDVDALAGLSTAPNTMLVHAEAEVILLPEGTDPAVVDPKAVKPTPDATGSVLSNPMRVNFGGAGA